jgi:hypothetical protein
MLNLELLDGETNETRIKIGTPHGSIEIKGEANFVTGVFDSVLSAPSSHVRDDLQIAFAQMSDRERDELMSYLERSRQGGEFPTAHNENL